MPFAGSVRYCSESSLQFFTLDAGLFLDYTSAYAVSPYL